MFVSGCFGGFGIAIACTFALFRHEGLIVRVVLLDRLLRSLQRLGLATFVLLDISRGYSMCDDQSANLVCQHHPS